MASLGPIKPGDIVEVEISGRHGVCKVDRKDGRELVLIPITANFTWRRATARQVVNHWRKTKNSRRSTAAAPKSSGSDPFVV